MRSYQHVASFYIASCCVHSSHRIHYSLYNLAKALTLLHPIVFLKLDMTERTSKDINEHRRQLCYPKIGPSLGDKEIRAALFSVFDQIPDELILEISEMFDPVTFAILRQKIEPYKEPYKGQLRKLLPNSRFAQERSLDLEEAYESYNTVLAARECILKSISDGLFPLKTESTVKATGVAPSYQTLFTHEDVTGRVIVWSLREKSLREIWRQDRVLNTEHLDTNVLWVVEESGSIDMWSFTDEAKRDFSMKLDPPLLVSVSRSLLLIRHAENTKLWRWSSSGSMSEISLPDSMRKVVKAAFSSDDENGILTDGACVYHMSMTTLPTPTVLKGDVEAPASQLLFSSDDHWFAARSWDALEVWRVGAVTDPPLTFHVPHMENDSDRLGRQLKSAAFSPTSTLNSTLIAALSSDGDKAHILSVLKISEGRLEEVLCRTCSQASCVAWFLNRRVLIGSDIIDIGNELGGEL